MKETNISKLIQIRASELGMRLLRNNVGKAWIGEAVPVGGGDVIIKNARRFHAGLGAGSSDLIGWAPVKITPEMVGKTVAVFLAVEVKRPKKNPTAEQVEFMDAVKKSGGYAMVARDPDDIDRIKGEII